MRRYSRSGASGKVTNLQGGLRVMWSRICKMRGVKDEARQGFYGLRLKDVAGRPRIRGATPPLCIPPEVRLLSMPGCLTYCRSCSAGSDRELPLPYHVPFSLQMERGGGSPDEAHWKLKVPEDVALVPVVEPLDPRTAIT
jgi:hypothetical protein